MIGILLENVIGRLDAFLVLLGFIMLNYRPEQVLLLLGEGAALSSLGVVVGRFTHSCGLKAEQQRGAVTKDAISVDNFCR